MAIKKAFVPLMDFLNDNQDKKVKTILDELTVFASAKTRGGGSGGASNILKDDKGEVVAILDYYFKRWMPVVGDNAVEFGKKASSASGYNSMCKEGVSNWTKQQREAKNALTQLIVDLEEGNIEVSEISSIKENIEAKRKEIVDTDMGYATLEDCKAALEDEGYTFE